MSSSPAPADDPWDPERVALIPDVQLPITRLRQLTIEYATTAHRPVGAHWNAVVFV